MATHERFSAMKWQARPLLASAVFSASLLVGLEWLFFVTKLSFMTSESWPTKLTILAAAPLPLVCAAALLVFAARVLALSTSSPLRSIAFGLAHLPAVLCLAALVLLLVDNFTNTLFGLAIQKTPSGWSFAYILLLLGALLVGRRAARWFTRGVRRAPGLARLAWALVAVSVIAAGTAVWQGRASGLSDDVLAGVAVPTERPNILLFGSDGVDATRTSAYGHTRPTTPFLEQLAEQSLFCENAFANSSHTTGSLISILTGRSPVQTRVVFPPDILTGEDAYRHFPGLLRRWGYHNLHISIRHFADAYDLNLRDGFDVSTFQRPSRLRLDAALGELPTYFMRRTLTRLRDRVLHILSASRTPAAIDEVQRPTEAGGWMTGRAVSHADSTRVEGLVEFLRETREPFFAHVHLMASHGPKFPISRPVFSPGGTQSREWLPDYYDDAILQFDNALERVLGILREAGQLENTIVVVYSDHGLRGSVRQRTPLLFRFPNADHVGRVRDNVENLDIVPTLLDYMGVERPEWVSGRSLLQIPHVDGTSPVDSVDAVRPEAAHNIFAASCNFEAWVKESDLVWVDPAKIGPPFFTLRYITLVACSRAYTVDLTQKQVRFEDVAGHTRPCPEEELPDPQDVFPIVIEYLRDNGYDVSSFTTK